MEKGKEKIEIKNKTFFKNKWQMIIYMIIFCVLIYLFIWVGTRDYSNDMSDNERFAAEYPLVGKDNVFKYINVTDAHMIASGKKGIVLFGNGSTWVEYYADIVNDAAQEVGINTVYYYDFSRDREQNNATYEDTVQTLKNYVIIDDNNHADIYAPTLLVVSSDEILLFDTEMNFTSGSMTPSTYWNNYNRGLKFNQLKTVFKEYLEN